MVPGFTERDGLAADQRRRQLVAEAARQRLVIQRVAARDIPRPAATVPGREWSPLRGASAVLVRFVAPWGGAFGRLTARP